MTGYSSHEVDPAWRDATWVVAGRGEELMCGPFRAMHAVEPRRASVTLLPPEVSLEMGEEVRRVEVRESGLREYVVTWHHGLDDPNVTIADNPAGRNQVAWSADRSRWWITNVDGGHVTSSHVRFVLRHLTTLSLVEDTGGHPVHAVTVQLPTGGVLAIAGPTTSGKTRLANRLVAAGTTGGFVDDDCPVLTATDEALSLVPARHEVVRARRERVRGIVLLRPDPGVTVDAARFLAETPAAWPATWLPGPDAPPTTRSAAGVPVLELDHRTDLDEAAVARVTAFVHHLD